MMTTTKTKSKTRVLVVDDSTFVRHAVTRMLESAADIEVVGTAADGREAIEKARELQPDVISLDIKMPRMDGLEALPLILAERPVAVLLLSSLTHEGGDVTLRGLELGALDFLDKSSAQGNMNLLSLADELVAKVRLLAAVPRERLAPPAAPAVPEPPRPVFAPRAEAAEVVAIGTSTGGPSALLTIVPRLPEDLASAVLVAQHMPQGFTRSLAERLNARSRVRVREAQEGDTVKAGEVLIGPAGTHLKVRRRGGPVKVWLDEEPRSALHRPSIDVLMGSVAKVYGPQALGILLTGMGSDGVDGLRAIRAAGGRTIAQDEQTSIIYGMPKAAVDAGVVDRSVPLARIAEEIVGAR
jgi:two-component system, chemotaxis family, protein-glutamate methylesterase/glutaminase